MCGSRDRTWTPSSPPPRSLPLGRSHFGASPSRSQATPIRVQQGVRHAASTPALFEADTVWLVSPSAVGSRDDPPLLLPSLRLPLSDVRRQDIQQLDHRVHEPGYLLCLDERHVTELVRMRSSVAIEPNMIGPVSERT